MWGSIQGSSRSHERVFLRCCDIMIPNVRMRFLIAIVLSLCVCGCQKKNRLEVSIERLDWSGGSSDDRRVRKLLLDSLESARVASLATPALVDVAAYFKKGFEGQGALRVNWIGDKPIADGLRVNAADGAVLDFKFDPVELEYNLQVAEECVFFSSLIFAEREAPELWAKVIKGGATAGLIAQGAPVSNAVRIVQYTPEN